MASARLVGVQVAPRSVLDLGGPPLEKATRQLLANLRGAMHSNVHEGRKVLRALLVDGLMMTHRQTDSGKEYAITGHVVLGDALSATAEPDQVSAVSIGGRPQRDSNPC